MALSRQLRFVICRIDSNKRNMYPCTMYHPVCFISCLSLEEKAGVASRNHVSRYYSIFFPWLSNPNLIPRIQKDGTRVFALSTSWSFLSIMVTIAISIARVDLLFAPKSAGRIQTNNKKSTRLMLLKWFRFRHDYEQNINQYNRANNKNRRIK